MKKKVFQKFIVILPIVFAITFMGIAIAEAQVITKKPVITISQVAVKKNSCTIKVGDKVKLTAKSGKKNITKKGTWKSSKKTVATISKSGKLTAKKAGTTKITITYKKKTSKKLKVVVKENATDTASPEPADTSTSDSETIPKPDSKNPEVYFTSDISPEGLIAVYKALGREAEGENVSVKISTGEGDSQNNYLRPELIGDFVQMLHGTIVECNTAVGGRRANTAMHYQVAKDHGFNDIAPVVIMDENGDMEIPVKNGKHLKSDRVGKHFAEYDFQVVLSHFKGHLNGGFGGAIKNMSIGYASSAGKNRSHTAGAADTAWLSFGAAAQDDFLESMAEAAKAVADYCGDNILYINVMNRLSVDCDCMPNPREPDMADIGILASLDPVALDQACVDLVYAASDGQALVQRIESLNGQHTLDYGEKIGLGSKNYTLVNIDEQQIPNEEETNMTNQLTDYPEQPTGEKMHQLEFGESPLLAQNAPFDAKELYFSFDEDLKAAEEKYAYYRFEVSGIAGKVGPDVHNKPSIELSDEVGGKCYVLCVFNSNEIYGKVSVGDHVVCRGNYLIASSLYGIVLKMRRLSQVNRLAVTYWV